MHGYSFTEQIDNAIVLTCRHKRYELGILPAVASSCALQTSCLTRGTVKFSPMCAQAQTDLPRVFVLLRETVLALSHLT